jgi:hypothetical protein
MATFDFAMFQNLKPSKSIITMDSGYQYFKINSPKNLQSSCVRFLWMDEK